MVCIPVYYCSYIFLAIPDMQTYQLGMIIFKRVVVELVVEIRGMKLWLISNWSVFVHV